MKLGIDLGSRSVKLALWNEESQSVTFKIYDTITFYRQFSSIKEGKVVLDFAALGLSNLNGLCACGYGKQAAALADAKVVSEIQAHAWGAAYQSGCRDFLLIDLGGQDSKIIRVEEGRIKDFSANDKCAAGSGRYLENMAVVLGISLDELSEAWEDPVNLSSTCAVFGESELIGKIIEGCVLKNLAAGVNYSVVRRLLPLLARYLPAPIIYFSGGVAASLAINRLLEKELGQQIQKLEEAQFMGAIGCCVSLFEGGK